MIGIDQLLGFGLAALVVIVIPGPSVVFVVGRAVAYGQRVALASVVGNTGGLFVIMSLVCVGLGAVVASSDVVFVSVQLVGAAYLVWLGVSAWRHRAALVVGDGTIGAPIAVRTAVRQGFVVGVSNPKGFIIFAAMLPPFVERSSSIPVPLQMLQLGVVAVVLGLVCDGVWASAAGRARDWFAGSPERGRALGALGGTSMILLGLGMGLAGVLGTTH